MHPGILCLRRGEQVVGADAERSGERRYVVEREPAGARFQTAQSRRVHAGRGRDLGEREPTLLSERSEPSPDTALDVLEIGGCACQYGMRACHIQASDAR